MDKKLDITLDLLDELRECLATLNDDSYDDVIITINSNLIDDFSKGYMVCKWEHITEDMFVNEALENFISFCADLLKTN